MARPQRLSPLWLTALAAAAITFLVFLPVLKGGFVNWDDDLNFLLNENYRGLSPGHLRWMFTTFHLGPYQPLSWLTLGIDYTLWGMDARGYHLTSLLLHSLNAGLLAVLAAAILTRAGAAGAPEPGSKRGAGAGPERPAARRTELAALIAALLFSVHPLRVESVAWVTERRDVLSGFFFLLALLAYVSEPRRPRLAFIAWMLSLLSKATGVTAPILLLVLDIYPLRRLPADPREWSAPRHRPVIREKILYLLVAIAFGVVALVGQRHAGSLETLRNFNPAQRLGLMSYAMVFYVVKTVAPLGLSPLYELKPDFNPLGPMSLLSVALLAGTTLFLFARRRRPALLAAWIAYIVLVLPVSGLARAGHAIAADRYTYFASMPFSLLAGALLAGFGERRERTAFGFGAIAALGLVAALGTLTVAQAKVWNNSVSLWQQALKVDSKSVNASLSLGYALVEAGRLPEAGVLYRDLLKRDPTLADARYNYGMMLYLDHRYAEAEAEFVRLTREAPGYADGHYGLGILYMFQNKESAARTELETTLRLDPRHRKAREALARFGAASR